MGYSKSTIHFNLPQFQPNDSAKWTSDINEAFHTIDTVMYENQANTGGGDIGNRVDALELANTGFSTEMSQVKNSLVTAQNQIGVLTNNIDSQGDNISSLINQVNELIHDNTDFTTYLGESEQGINRFWQNFENISKTMDVGDFFENLGTIFKSITSSLNSLTAELRNLSQKQYPLTLGIGNIFNTTSANNKAELISAPVIKYGRLLFANITMRIKPNGFSTNAGGDYRFNYAGSQRFSFTDNEFTGYVTYGDNIFSYFAEISSSGLDFIISPVSVDGTYTQWQIPLNFNFIFKLD